MINFSSYMYLQDVISTLYFPELKYSILIFQTYGQDLLHCSINFLCTGLNSNNVLSKQIVALMKVHNI